MPRSPRSSLRDTTLPLVLIAGDTLTTFGALTLSWWLRYASPLERMGIHVPDATFHRYLPLLLAGVALLVAAFAQFGLYDSRLLLRRYQSLNAILKGASFWLVAYLGLSLVLEFDPPIYRLFVVLAFLSVVTFLFLWRTLVYVVAAGTGLIAKLQRRTALLGWSEQTRSLADTIRKDSSHPLAFCGVIRLPEDQGVDSSYPVLGTLPELETILERHSIDLLIATRSDLGGDGLRAVVEQCEKAYVEWKVVPAAFDIFLSGLRLQTLGRVPVLGVEELPINRLFYRALKRAIDIAGALAGLVVGLPVVLVLAILIKRKSPTGSVLFRQTRIGSGHRPFTLYKLRSMNPDASLSDHHHQSTTADDPRVFPLGAFMRRWNLDELPQFWNVLKGDMSLVGPRPERPFHVERLATTIPHYLPRHLVKPGMTGWAQVNGLRGASDLEARIQHDIFYIENWSVWLDLQIMLLTFVRWRNHPEA